jgi:hypothetical protein
MGDESVSESNPMADFSIASGEPLGYTARFT